MKKSYTSFNTIKYLLGILLVSQIFLSNAQTVSTFDDLTLTPDSYWNGSDESGKFTSGNARFANSYNVAWGSGTGFFYSNKTDITTPGYGNQYSAYTGGGYNGSANYAIGYTGPVGIKLLGNDAGKKVNGFFVSNTTYTALSMKDGDDFAKKFGGLSGDDPDWFKLTITGYLNEVASSTTVDFYLADFRFEDNSQDYILNTWKWVDLNSLGNVDSLSFSFSSSDNGQWGMNTPGYFAMDNFNDPLFAPAVGVTGTTAIHKDDASFVAWATGASIVRGLKDVSTGGPADTANVGTYASALGVAGTAGVVSLGDGGSATLTFANPIKDEEGADFAIFENGFAGTDGMAFLELGFVEVSSDGVNFVRFPATSLNQETTQFGSFELMDTRKINNLAGKYVSSYGTPFDLQELEGSANLDIDKVTHIRIIDVVGTIDPEYATYDAHGNVVNDPWKTDFGSGGFDLDAVGVIHQSIATGIIAAVNSVNQIAIYPNPAAGNQEITISLNGPASETTAVQIFDYSGQLVKEEIITSHETKISTEDMNAGMYIVKLSNENGVSTGKLVVK